MARADSAKEEIGWLKVAFAVKDSGDDSEATVAREAASVKLIAVKSRLDQPVLDAPAGGSKKATAVDRVPARKTHTVRAGETLLEIARSHNVSADELRKLNNLRGGHVTPGQKLLLPA